MKRTGPTTGETVEPYEEHTEVAVETCAWGRDHYAEHAEHAGRHLQAEHHPRLPGASGTTDGEVTIE